MEQANQIIEFNSPQTGNKYQYNIEVVNSKDTQGIQKTSSNPIVYSLIKLRANIQHSSLLPFGMPEARSKASKEPKTKKIVSF